MVMKVDVVDSNMYMMVKESEKQSTHTIATTGLANSLHTMGMLDSSESFYEYSWHCAGRHCGFDCNYYTLSQRNFHAMVRYFDFECHLACCKKDGHLAQLDLTVISVGCSRRP